MEEEVPWVVMGSPKRRNNLVIEQRPVNLALLHRKQRPIGASTLSNTQVRTLLYLL